METIQESNIIRFLIDAWYRTDDKRLENHIDIIVNKNFDLFQSEQDALDRFQDFIDNSKKLIPLGKCNQFERLELFEIRPNGKRLSICKWDYNGKAIKWSKK